MLLAAFLMRLRSNTDGPGLERRRTLIAPDSLTNPAGCQEPCFRQGPGSGLLLGTCSPQSVCTCVETCQTGHLK